ncbi:MAG: hypothetical protein V8S74_11420 [Lachnospirales bacterium]
MAKSVNQKMKVFYLRKILLENTDKDHYLTMLEILDALKERGIKAERKSIYNDIDMLRELGLEIVNHKRLGYAVVKKDFDCNEIELLIKGLDNIDIVEKQKQHIVNKLKKLVSIYEAKEILSE